MEFIKDIFDDKILSIEKIYQDIRIMFSFILKNESNCFDYIEIQKQLLVVFNYFSINKEQHAMLSKRICKTFDFFPLAYEYYMSSIEDERKIMQLLRLPKEYCRWILWFEMFKYIDISNPVFLKDFLEQLRGNYKVAIKFCLYYEVYCINNGYNEARSMLYNLQYKAKEGKEEPFLITHLDICGRDLIELGFKGKEIGLKMREILQSVKADPTLNNKYILLEMV